MKAVNHTIRIDIASRLISIIAPVVILGACLHMLMALATTEGQSYRLMASVVAIVLMIPAWILNYNGMPRAAVPFFILCTIAPILVGMVLSGGVHAPAYAGILTVPCVLLCIYGLWSAALFSLVMFLLGLMSIKLQEAGFFPLPVEPSSYYLLFNYTIWLFMSLCMFAVPIHMLLKALNESEFQRKKAGRAVADRIAAEQELKAILSNTPDIIFRLDTRNCLTFINDAVERYGYPAGAVLGKSFSEFIHPDDQHRFSLYQQNNRTSDHQAGHLEIRFLTSGHATEKTGTYESFPTLMVDIEPLYEEKQGGSREWIGYQGVARDITQRKDYELRLMQLATVIEQADDEVVLTDTEGTVIYVNPKFVAATGYCQDEVLGTKARLLGGEGSDGQLIETIWNMISGGKPWKGQIWDHTEDGRRVLYDTTITPIINPENDISGYALTRRDVTGIHEMQNIMVQTEKMMAIGGLAAGMAHEINNPLGIILQANQNIQRRLGTELATNRQAASALGLDLRILQEYLHARAIDTYLESISEAGMRAARIVRSMLDFSRKSESRRALHSMNVILDSVLEMVANDYDFKKNYDFKSIEIVREYTAARQVPCTETEIAQVFFNLIKNAGQALTEDSKGQENPQPRLTLRTRDTETCVRVEIEDNGPGIDEAIQEKIFEPFFTTKPPGEGTGLGLSVSYFIITTNHGGTMAVQSRSGRGTCFSVELPVEERRWI